jgi:hypothetical protein
MYVYVYIYKYMQRERERGRERGRCIHIYIYIQLHKSNPVPWGAHFASPSGILLASFRHASLSALRFRVPLAGGLVTLPVPFRCPSGILPAYGCFDTPRQEILGAVPSRTRTTWARAQMKLGAIGPNGTQAKWDPLTHQTCVGFGDHHVLMRRRHQLSGGVIPQVIIRTHATSENMPRVFRVNKDVVSILRIDCE